MEAQNFLMTFDELSEKFHLQNVESDGNCLFPALCLTLNEKQDNHHRLRSQI